MKSKLLLPLVAAALAMCFVACGDDSESATQPEISQPVAPPDDLRDTTQSIVPDVPVNTDPADPTQSTDPVIPSDPIEPTNPTEPVNPTEPTNPIEPTDPVVPVDTAISPVDPVNPDTSVTPVVPEEPAQPSYSYYGAELSGNDQFTYGRFEARMKMVSIPGSVSSMFLYYDESYLVGDEPWNEIDIEVLGKGGTSWQANLITREANYIDEATGKEKKNAKLTSESKSDFGFDATEDFHLYALIWTPEYIAWEIDSVEIRRDTLGTPHPKNANHDQVAFMTEQQTLRFNLWASKSSSWVGKFTGNELADGPQIQWIDYVRVYSYDKDAKTFTQEWQDDFEGDKLSSHWSAGNWEMEKVMLSKKNVVVEDGYCKLLMTRVEE
ncbi:MAG: family 16 glycosylhydrolase [Fibrobacter sp.]|nr:family 16 glycosylhydrolase [Fibrobacter sp.]